MSAPDDYHLNQWWMEELMAVARQTDNKNLVRAIFTVRHLVEDYNLQKAMLSNLGYKGEAK